MSDPLAPLMRRAEEVQSVEGRERHQGLQHLDVETQPHDESSKEQVAETSTPDGFNKCPGGQQQHEHQQSVHGVVAFCCDGCGQDRQR